ncbi:lipid IV(A) 3-deoxy-D-manno-octulosonic acid transferase [Thalassotalea sp. SU-HH00458]
MSVVRYSLSLFIYRITLILLFPLILLVFIIRSHNHTAYRQRVSERLGFVSKLFKQNGVIVHAASVGEVIAITPFIKQLLRYHPNIPLTITTFTPTGSAQVIKTFNDQVQHCYLPLDIWPCTWLFLKALKPKALVLMETELWPNLIAHCQQKHIKLQLINGRLSDKSMASYQKLSWLIKPCLQRFDAILTQSEENYQNFIALGADPQNCQISGNLKFDLQINPDVASKQQVLEQCITEQRQIWLVASTHPGDEQLTLDCFTTLRKEHPTLLLILVPRHPERFESIFQLCQQHQFHTVKRSEHNSVTIQDDIWLIDTLGELLPACALADIVTMGGSFSTIGGHNPLEPALFKKAVIVGHDMANFKEVLNQLQQQHGIVQLNTRPSNSADEITSALSNKVNQLLVDRSARNKLGENAYKVVKANQGASEKSVIALVQLIDNQ